MPPARAGLPAAPSRTGCVSICSGWWTRWAVFRYTAMLHRYGCPFTWGNCWISLILTKMLPTRGEKATNARSATASARPFDSCVAHPDDAEARHRRIRHRGGGCPTSIAKSGGAHIAASNMYM